MANENNIFQQLIQPVTPKVLAQERIYVYVPQASTKIKGISSYDETQFQLDAGHVKIKINDPTTIPSLVQVDKDDFVYENGIVKINWPYAYDKSGSVKTNGYGLIKIADNSQDYLKYTDNGLLAVDIVELDKHINLDEIYKLLDTKVNVENNSTNSNGKINQLTYDEYSNIEITVFKDNNLADISLISSEDGYNIVFTTNYNDKNVSINIGNGNIDIHNTNDIIINDKKFDLSNLVDLTTTQTISGDKNFTGNLMYKNRNLLISNNSFNLPNNKIINTEIDMNTIGAINITADLYENNIDTYNNSLMIAPNGILIHTIDNQNSRENKTYIGIEGAGKMNTDGTIDIFATESYVDTKINDITSIKIRNVDDKAIEATSETVQTIATNYIVEKLGRQPQDYDGLFITMTDNKNDIVEWAYFGATWVNVGINGTDLSNYVNLSEPQTILGDKNFTGKLQHNGVDVTTTREAQKAIILGADGIEEEQAYSFTVKDSDSYLSYRTNGTKFLCDLHLPVVGDLTLNKKVAITFGDTTYYIYNILKGGEPISIRDLHQVDKYNNATGYRFISEMIFFQTSDLTGFYIVPTVSMSDILSLNSDEMDAYMMDGGLTQGQIALCTEVGQAGGYDTGSLYKFKIVYPNTYSWEKLNNENKLQLVGTEENPINFATSMEKGKLYSCSGWVYVENAITKTSDAAYGRYINFYQASQNNIAQINPNSSLLIYKYTNNYVLLLNSNIAGNTYKKGTAYQVSASYYEHIRFTFDNRTGAITGTNSASLLKSVNGDFTSDGFQDIYAPNTSGEEGQILQSNGEGKAPTWVNNSLISIDESTLGRTINFATEMEKGKIYLLNNCDTIAIRGTWKGLNVRLRSSGQTYQILKYSSNQLIFENCNLSTQSLNFGGGVEKYYTFNASYYSYARVTIDTTTGLITNIEPVLLLKGVNGNNLASGASNIYAPHTSGTVGQILQSNGENQEPTWTNIIGNVNTVTYDNTTLADHIDEILGYVNTENGGNLINVNFKVSDAITGEMKTVTNTLSTNTLTNSTGTVAIINADEMISLTVGTIRNGSTSGKKVTFTCANDTNICSFTNVDISNINGTPIATISGQEIDFGTGTIITNYFKGINILNTTLEHLVINYYTI